MTSFSCVMVIPHGLECNAGFHLQGRQGESFLQQTHTLLSCFMHQHTHTPATHYMYDTCTPFTTKTNHLQPHQKFITPQQPPPKHTNMHGEPTHITTQHSLPPSNVIKQKTAMEIGHQAEVQTNRAFTEQHLGPHIPSYHIPLIL